MTTKLSPPPSTQPSRRRALTGLALVLAALVGCKPPVNSVAPKPTLYTLGDNGHVVTYDARQRGAYIVQPGEGAKALKICAEPPPDVAANESAESSIKANLELMVQYSALQVGGKGGGESLTKGTSEIADAATRTELVLGMRDMLYRVCEMNANQVLTNEQAAKIFADAMRTTRMLGQRDNVGKLVEVLRVMLESADKEGVKDISQQLITDAFKTIQLLAAVDFVNRSEAEIDRMVLQSFILSNTVSAEEVTRARAAFEALRKDKVDEIKRLEAPAGPKEDKSTKEKREGKIKSLQSDIEGLDKALETLR
ncbi:hypothetical protein OV090_12480 [Nannocystis sp. RBIL2]|uniref:hypothetical protein n=1 Tax=Nannocystis sp. RBIL2 TaxID=2996788 RepID=UPI00226DC30F|nr:hypothetical protein [Nannocystis sp. RBIL2]MCY1065588.1 hypothetical protein [Nannocystis sp. RBIL2]